MSLPRVYDLAHMHIRVPDHAVNRHILSHYILRLPDIDRNIPTDTLMSLVDDLEHMITERTEEMKNNGRKSKLQRIRDRPDIRLHKEAAFIKRGGLKASLRRIIISPDFTPPQREAAQQLLDGVCFAPNMYRRKWFGQGKAARVVTDFQNMAIDRHQLFDRLAAALREDYKYTF